MNYRTPEDKKLITATAAFSSSIVHECVEQILESKGFSYEKRKKGWEEFYEIKAKDKSDVKVEFFLHNLYLEIATKDRDLEPLEWDSRLLDFSFFRKKIADVISSKIRPLLIAFSTDDAKKLDERLTKLAKNEGFRMRMWRWDKEEDKEKDENK